MKLSKWQQQHVNVFHLKRRWKNINSQKFSDCEKRAAINNIIELRMQGETDREWFINNEMDHNSMKGLQPGDVLPVRKSNKIEYPTLTDEQRKRVLEYIPYAVKRANKFKRDNPYTGSLTDDDLEMIAILALCRAISLYDPTKGTKVTTFIHNFVKYALINSIRDYSRLVKLQNGIISNRRKIAEMKESGLSDNEIKDKLNISDWDYALCERSWKDKHASIYYTRDGEEYDETPVMQIASPMPFFSKFSKEANNVIANISDEDFLLLDDYYKGKLLSNTRRERAISLIEEIKQQIADNEAAAKQK